MVAWEKVMNDRFFGLISLYSSHKTSITNNAGEKGVRIRIIPLPFLAYAKVFDVDNYGVSEKLRIYSDACRKWAFDIACPNGWIVQTYQNPANDYDCVDCYGWVKSTMEYDDISKYNRRKR